MCAKKLIVCRKLTSYDLRIVERIVDRTHVAESQDKTVAYVMSRFNKAVTFTPDAIEQIDSCVKTRKAANLKEYRWIMGGLR